MSPQQTCPGHNPTLSEHISGLLHTLMALKYSTLPLLMRMYITPDKLSDLQMQTQFQVQEVTTISNVRKTSR